MTQNKKKIIVAMSGGVDSSVAAALLAREGHEVIGVTMKLLPRGGEGFGCCGSPDDVMIAKRSADKVGIPHYVLDYSPDFEKDVINYFVNSYVAGETPNPCLACNKHIKFDKLKNFADSVDATHVATGHYGRVLEKNGTYHLYESKDLTKDQSYVLYNFTQKGLGATLLPIGHAPKTEIRAIAREIGLPNADKEDSQEICFVPRKDYRSYIKNRIEEQGAGVPLSAQAGHIRDTSGKIIGTHEGVAFYTIGQRKGLQIDGINKPMYVTKLDPKTNTVVVGREGADLVQEFTARELTWIHGQAPGEKFTSLVKIRYKHEPAMADVTLSEGRAQVRFHEAQRAVSPGQAAVFYRWDEHMKAREVLGGGKIAR
jgi:tRNA-specific 2-thiouridylase